MTRQKIERAEGVILAIGLLALFIGVLSLNQRSSESDESPAYEVVARFDNVGGLKTGSLVKASGVKIGRVAAIDYDVTGYQAVVTLSIDAQYNQFPIDTAASVLTIGLVGEQYIGLQPGAETSYLVSGSEIDLTQSALVLEQIIGQFLYSKANE